MFVSKSDTKTYKEITVKVLSETEASLLESSELTGMSAGQLIDRMTLNWEADNPEVAAILILQDMITHIQKLDQEQINQAFMIVLGVIKESLAKDEPEIIKKLVAQIESLLYPKDKFFQTKGVQI